MIWTTCVATRSCACSERNDAWALDGLLFAELRIVAEPKVLQSPIDAGVEVRQSPKCSDSPKDQTQAEQIP